VLVKNSVLRAFATAQRIVNYIQGESHEQFRIRIADLTTTAAGLMKYARKDAEKMNEAIDLKSFYASVECVEHERNNQSTKHKHKNNHQRAAQFAPFATLTGYDAVIDETTKLTDEKLELSDEQTEFLNQQIQLLIERISEKQKWR